MITPFDIAGTLHLTSTVPEAISLAVTLRGGEGPVKMQKNRTEMWHSEQKLTV